MRKRLFNYLTAVSSLTCALSFVLLFVSITIPFTRKQLKWRLEVSNAAIMVSNDVGVEEAAEQLTKLRHARIDTFRELHQRWRNDCQAARLADQPLPPEPQEAPEINDPVPNYVWYRLSLPLVFGCSTILPAIWYVLLLINEKRIRDRKAAGCCVECGFDLRHSPTRCPECGTLTRTPRTQSKSI